MSRRGRAVAFASAAAICAGVAAGAAGGPAKPEPQFGELREIVVAAASLPARRRLREADLGKALELRRVPESFVPPGALTVPAQAAGRTPVVPIPAGSPLLASHFDSSARDGRSPGIPALAPGRRPTEIAVAGAGALAASAAAGPTPVDVIVTSEPGPGGGAGRTYIAARSVELLDLRAVEGAPLDDVTATGNDAWMATLALTRTQALRLIQAESFARSVRLLGR